jgi:hypothetical protein
MTTAEYQAADALGTLLRNLPGVEEMTEAGLLPVVYKDHVANTVAFTVNGVEFHAVVVAA